MKNNLPNFLIVGAAKSGTTSLYNHLKRHPEIYMPKDIKETFFFVQKDFKQDYKGLGHYGHRIILELDDYIRLFKKAREKAIGEACAGYLYYHKESIPNIKFYLRDPKIIIILRNPVERAFSNYLNHVRDNNEVLGFEDALKAQKERAGWWWGYQFVKVGLYYEQVKAYLDNFSSVKIYLFDDLKENPKGLIKDAYSFLSVDSSFIPNNLGKRYNISGVPKYKPIYNILTKPNPIRFAAKVIVKTLAGQDKKKAFGEKMRGYLLEKPEMKEETREYLKEVFREDILALQDLINRDLTHWLK